MLPAPFIIYADFESYLTKLPPETKSSYAYELHEPSGFGYYVVCADASRQYEPVVYRGTNVVEEFLKRLQQESEKIVSVLKTVKPMNLSPDEQISFLRTEVCYLCDEPLGADRVRDHDHITGG